MKGASLFSTFKKYVCLFELDGHFTWCCDIFEECFCWCSFLQPRWCLTRALGTDRPERPVLVSIKACAGTQETRFRAERGYKNCPSFHAVSSWPGTKVEQRIRPCWGVWKYVNLNIPHGAVCGVWDPLFFASLCLGGVGG